MAGPASGRAGSIMPISPRNVRFSSTVRGRRVGRHGLQAAVGHAQDAQGPGGEERVHVQGRAFSAPVMGTTVPRFSTWLHRARRRSGAPFTNTTNGADVATATPSSLRTAPAAAAVYRAHALALRVEGDLGHARVEQLRALAVQPRLCGGHDERALGRVPDHAVRGLAFRRRVTLEPSVARQHGGLEQERARSSRPAARRGAGPSGARPAAASPRP